VVTGETTGTGFTVWLTGLSGAGKSTIAQLLAIELTSRGRRVEVLDGDSVREHLSPGLSFSKEDRDTNIRRIGWVCELLTRNDVIAIAAAISPYREVRNEVRARIGRFVEVYLEAPVGVLAERDAKGLYRQAREGTLTDLSGVNDPYEPPDRPELTIRTDVIERPEESVARLMSRLEELGYLPARDDGADSAYTADEESEVTDRLRDLGYL
jgi:adenylyl-sulfate kinase